MDHDDSMLSTPSSDGDIDESMITDPTHDTNDDEDDDDEEQDLYPESGGMNKHSDMIGRPHTPQNDHLNAAAPGELSPPRSQTTTQDGTTTTRTRTGAAGGVGLDENDDLDLSPTNPNLGAVGTGSIKGLNVTTATTAAAGAGAGAGTGTSAATEWKAGHGWKSKKAQLDMKKARDGLSDRDFSLKIFGDVLAHRIGVEAGARN